MKRNQHGSLTRRDLLKQGALASGGIVVGAGTAGATPGRATGGGRTCDVVVPDDYGTIQGAVDDAASGDAICIRPGTYPERVTVDTGVTLRGQTAPNSSNPAVVDGRISIEADDVAVRRLRIAASGTFEAGTFPDPFGVRVTASNAVVENNVVEDFHGDVSEAGSGADTFTLHGVQVFGLEGADVSDVAVRGNVIRGFANEGGDGWPAIGGVAGVKAQADVEGVTVRSNRITDHHSAGWVWGVVLTPSGSAPGVPHGVTVEGNHLSGLNDGSAYDVFAGANEGRDVAPYPGSAVGIDGADAGEATVRRNDLLAPNGAESKDEATTLVAECNWWGSRSGPTHAGNADGEGTWALERGNASIDYTPWLVAPAPSRACRGGSSGGDNRGHS